MRDALDLKEFKPNRKVPNYAPPTQKFSQQWLPVQKKNRSTEACDLYPCAA